MRVDKINDASMSDEISSHAIQDILVTTQFVSTGADFVDRLAFAEAGFASKLLLANSMQASVIRKNDSMQ